MSRTIGRHRPKKSPIGDYETLCDLCGIAYLRSDLTKDQYEGRLRCRDCVSERSPMELDQGNALAATRPGRRGILKDGGNWDHLYDPPAEVEI